MAFDIEATRTFRGVVDAEEEDLVIKFKTSSASVFKTDESCNPEKITFDTSEGTERDTSNFRIGVGGAGEAVEDEVVSEAGLSLIAVGVVLQILFGAAVPFLGIDVVAGVIKLVTALGSQGLVGLVAVAVLYWAFNKK